MAPQTPSDPAAIPASVAGASADGIRPLKVRVAELERQAIAEAMRSTGGNKLATARLLGISRAKLYASLSDFDV